MKRRKRIYEKEAIWGFRLNSIGHLLKENEATKVFFLKTLELKLFTGLKCFGFILYTFLSVFSPVFRIKLVDGLKLAKIPKVLCFSLTCFSSLFSLLPLSPPPFASSPSSALFPVFLLPCPPFPINQNTAYIVGVWPKTK